MHLLFQAQPILIRKEYLRSIEKKERPDLYYEDHCSNFVLQFISTKNSVTKEDHHYQLQTAADSDDLPYSELITMK